jgi:histidine triad (HIT) family protein
MSPDAACVFCKIRDGEIPSMRVYEDDRTLAFMDINPLNAGHCLVITKTHAPTIWESDPTDLQAAITAAQKVALGLRKAVKPDGLNVLQANGAAAFQSVPHYHLHLIPRWNNDGKGFDWKLVPGDRAQIQAVGERLREALDAQT